ncbi:steroid 5-alpha reductase family enzyme [Stackebrandtia albiflava]|uniref:Steroid 5-alpha reductase family enzyme n=1 Tax=Stackebrandtia albiflava TaxID=406432 RepID=A0A562VAN0_9ACTN|nr:DUF1295 domain-containing protein [Stackebrandtia albiflava]TWJ14936.1 steroid 5-alpha reductase family enzyme [Stackebrandtia albiflava]
MNHTVWQALAVNAAVCLAVALTVGVIAFAVGTARQRHRVVDVAWGLGFAAIAVTGLYLSEGHGDPVRRWVVTAATVVWGIRLAVHIGWRSRGHGEDPRYERLLAKAPGDRTWYALRMVYLLQAGLIWFISLPVQVAQYDASDVDGWLYAGAAVWLVGFGFEAVSDHQLARFRSDPANRGRVLDSGLWRYSRHPNYFGDACVWWGLFLIAAGGLPGAATVLSPLVMTYFLAAKTGRPLMDAHMSRTRPGYADYIRRTSGFIPLPPRRS